MKKLLALVLALTLVFCLFAGCTPKDPKDVQPSAENSETPATDPAGSEPKPFTIGFAWDTANPDPNWISIHNNVTAVVEAAGGKIITVESDFTADSLINNVAELISRDVDGILYMPASDSMLPTVDAMCAEAGVYWGTIFRTISDEAIKEQIYASKYYAGGCFEDDEACAANVVKAMAKMGTTDLACINIAKGDTSSDLRDKGAAKGVEEAKINLLNTTYGIAETTNMTKTIESYIAAYPELNGILILGTYCPAALPTIEKTLEDHDLAGKVKVGRIDFDSTMGEYLEKGSFHVSYGGQMQIDTLMSAVILVNKVMGTPIKEEGPTIVVTPYLELTSAADAEAYNNFFLGDETIYTKDEIKDLLIKFYNKDADYDYFVDLLSKFSIADVVARHS
ncbi:MAG: substrate-binding domain-containing protein [Christensenellaceae bacterium]